MAEHKQDLITFDDDTFKIRYTFLSIINELNFSNQNEFIFDSNFGAFWSAGLNSDWPTIPTIVRSKATANWTYAVTYTPSDYNITVINNTAIIDVNFNQSDFNGADNLLTNTEYYTELVIANKADESNSIVAATGLFYVSASLFSAAEYRP
jgi:hypothetical protein